MKVLTDLEKLRDAFSIDIKVLTDLKKRRNKALYRHEGPNRPKEVPPLHPEPLSKRTTTGKPAAHFAGAAQHLKRHPSSGLEDLHVYSAPARKGS